MRLLLHISTKKENKYALFTESFTPISPGEKFSSS